MGWVKKHFPTTWATDTVLDDFVQLFMALGGPSRMMLVEEVHARRNSTLWIWLPREDLLDAFPGFAPAGDPPTGVVLLAGNRSGFTALFGR
jgi:hypothetical protein